ncbi:MAG TPA: hypothetical protein VE338_11075 [Ktedonobacterales bacterium]|jgi:DNA-binding beta-propeller fold protein YncE|nr:hypothetical protein [Ktedonobacterales bacterium]
MRAVGAWLAVVACVAVLAYVLVGVVRQLVNPPSPLRLVLMRDVPLPSGLGASSAGASDPLAPGVSAPFDTFDFQAYDPQTRLLFIAHTGPNPDKLHLAHIKYDPATDGHIIVFNTARQQIVGRINIPHVAGIAVAGDLHRVYAADAVDNSVFAIDENTLAFTPIQLGNNESPDAVSYDPVDHRIFVSDPGAPANPDKTANIDRNNQNLVVIDALAERVIARITIGAMPKLAGERAPTVKGSGVPLFGYDLGHNQYDSAQHRIFMTTQILPDADSPKPNILPPPGTGELMEIDPIAAKVVQRTQLPATCITPHGLALDTVQEVAFIACVEFDAASNIAPNLTRVDLRTMRVIPANPQVMRLAPRPDIVVLDHSAHALLVGCKGGVSIFDERAGEFHKLGDYQMGANTHSIFVDEATQYVYLPMDVGGRPVLRVARYNPSGA